MLWAPCHTIPSDLPSSLGIYRRFVLYLLTETKITSMGNLHNKINYS